MRTTSPRKLFLETQGAEFAEHLSHQTFVAGIQAALLEFQLQIPECRTWEDAARAHYRVQGAKDFADFLLGFVDEPKQQQAPHPVNLQAPTKEWLQQQQQEIRLKRKSPPQK